MNDYPTMKAYADQTIIDMMDKQAAAILAEYPVLAPQRAIELAAAMLCNQFDDEYTHFNQNIQTLVNAYGVDAVDNFKFDIMDREDIDGGIFNVLINESGTRSVGFDRQELRVGGIDHVLESHGIAVQRQNDRIKRVNLYSEV